MQQAMTSKLTGYLVALLFSIILTACGGGTQGIDEYSNTGTGTGSPTPGPLPTANKSITLSWVPPLSYTDGSSFDDLAGHYIYMKTGSGNFVKIEEIPTAGRATTVVGNLSTGITYTFAVTAYNSSGVESSFSVPVSVTL